MAYATREDLAQYMGVPDTELPTDTNRLLDRASELMDEVTMGKTALSENALVAKNAVVRQVEFWLTMGDDSGDIVGASNFSSHNAGDVHINGRIPTLAPRAKLNLRHAGLLYRGVGTI